MRTIYVLVGLPFSGKTTLAQSLLTNDALLIERDRFLEDVNRDRDLIARLKIEALAIPHPESKLWNTKEENAYNDALTREYARRVSQAIRVSDKKVVIVDGTHLQPLSRSFIKDFPDADRIACVLKTDAEECVRRWERSRTQDGIRSTVTADMIRRLARVIEWPSREEGFQEIRDLS